jgi:trehalose 6-phosphate synthase/phosphatase
VKKKLIIIANRLPVRFERTAQGLHCFDSEGGLATGLSSLNSEFIKEWVGWPGIHAKDSQEQNEIADSMDENYHPVFLTKKEIDKYYKGFSNETLWPLFHYFMNYTHFDDESWEAYKLVNEKFCNKIIEIVKEGDILWVHDYHLMLLPKLLRDRLQGFNPIGFFLHIPFPSYELFRTLPWRKELLEGLLGADLIGFHTFEYMQNFTSTVYRILGYENRLGAIDADGRLVYTNAFPMSINFEKFNTASKNKGVVDQLKTFRNRFGNVKLILSVDRLDYTKGIPNRLRAFDLLLKKFPELKCKVSFILLTVPSRDNVGEYKKLKIEVDEMVGSINGQHSTLTWTAVHYFYRSVSFEQLIALYNLANIAFITPLRDGMNLVAKEYISSKNNESGVLILSEMAGAAIELNNALLVNPNDENEMVKALYTALHMDKKEQDMRLKKMQQYLKENSVNKWANSFTTELYHLYEKTKQIRNTLINGKETTEICAAFAHAEKRLILLDYDGTLKPFYTNPYDAKPDQELRTLLYNLSQCATVVLLSGRDHFVMEEWFGGLDIQLIAEHGIWRKEDGNWKQAGNISNTWKGEVFSILQEFVEKTPGSFIEEKPFSLAFHYRQTDNWLSEIRAPQLINILNSVCTNNNLNILDGNKVIEVRIAGVDKGHAAAKWISSESWDFIMAIGDDKTDEDMFRIAPDTAYTIKVGSQYSKAKWRIRNYEKVRKLLEQLITINEMYKADVKTVLKVI